jgi:PilZ domain-containing protein
MADASDTAAAGQEERRHATRVRLGSLVARLDPACEGVLVDLSETGALLRLPVAQSPGEYVSIQVELTRARVEFSARVIRSNPRGQERSIMRPWPLEYDVGVEFTDSQFAAPVVRHILATD